MIEEINYVSEQQRIGYDRFESYSLYNSNTDTPKQKIGNEYIFATIVDGYLFRVRQFEYYPSMLDDEFTSPNLVIVDLLDVYSNSINLDVTHIKTYECMTNGQSDKLFDIICSDKKYFWIISEYLDRHHGHFDVNDDIILFEDLQEYLYSKLGIQT